MIENFRREDSKLEHPSHNLVNTTHGIDDMELLILKNHDKSEGKRQYGMEKV